MVDSLKNSDDLQLLLQERKAPGKQQKRKPMHFELRSSCRVSSALFQDLICNPSNVQVLSKACRQ